MASRRGSPRPVQTLQDSVLAGLGKKFQTRVYRLDAGLTRLDKTNDTAGKSDAGLGGLMADSGAKCRGRRTSNAGLRQLVAETSDLPVGAVVLLSDGAETGTGETERGIDVEVDQRAAQSCGLPVPTIGLGKETPAHDLEIDDAVVAAKAMADSRMTAVVSFHQYGYMGQKATLDVKDGDKLLATKDVTLGKEWRRRERDDVLQLGRCEREEPSSSRWSHCRARESAANNGVTRLLDVSPDQKRISICRRRAAVGSSSSSSARRRRIKAWISSRCCARRKTRFTGRGVPIE